MQRHASSIQMQSSPWQPQLHAEFCSCSSSIILEREWSYGLDITLMPVSGPSRSCTAAVSSARERHTRPHLPTLPCVLLVCASTHMHHAVHACSVHDLLAHTERSSAPETSNCPVVHQNHPCSWHRFQSSRPFGPVAVIQALLCKNRLAQRSTATQWLPQFQGRDTRMSVSVSTSLQAIPRSETAAGLASETTRQYCTRPRK